jgi:hypothetical protein
MNSDLSVNLDFSSAKEFFDCLSPVGGLGGGGYEHRTYIYRGLESEEYELIPSAFRRGQWLKHMGRWFPAPRRKTAWQIGAEVETLWTFFEIADRHGLRLPEDSQSLRSTFEECRSSEYPQKNRSGLSVWPPSGLLSIMALAQHYGVPTRLLDWSWSPYIAAYFAASGACGKLVAHPGNIQNQRLIVWVLDTHFMKLDSIMVKLIPGERPIQLVSAPAADNENLRAQQGLFLLFRPEQFDPEADFICEPFDEALVRAAQTWATTVPIFYKLTLPWTEADELLRILNIVGINAASIKPGFLGAAEAVKEMRFWPALDDWIESDRHLELSAYQRKILADHRAFQNQDQDDNA